MGLLNLFSKNGRDSIKAKFEYDDCSKTRQARFHSYRKNAIQDIIFKYPDAQLLLNRLDQRFMIFLGSQGILQVGKFANDYYPKLDYIDDLATLEKRQTAVTQFRYQANRCVGSISEEAMPRFKNACRWLSKNVTETFQKKGYAITGKVDLKYLTGGALFLNERQIAKATI